MLYYSLEIWSATLNTPIACTKLSQKPQGWDVLKARRKGAELSSSRNGPTLFISCGVDDDLRSILHQQSGEAAEETVSKQPEKRPGGEADGKTVSKRSRDDAEPADETEHGADDNPILIHTPEGDKSFGIGTVIRCSAGVKMTFELGSIIWYF